MAELSKSCAKYIVLAQMCSDAGKGIWAEYEHRAWRVRAEKFGYRNKPMFIMKAMDEISKLRGTSGFHYFISRGIAEWGEPCDLVYFNFKIEGVRHQISFHVPELVPDRYLKRSGHGTRWDEKSSREACLALAKAVL